MGILESLGVKEGLFDFFYSEGFILWVGIIFLGFVILLVVGGTTFLYYFKKAKKKAFKSQIPIFKTVNGKPKRIGLDWAKELFVPDSNISLFYLKNYKIYLARPTRAMGSDEYWYSISENGEWVNFDMSFDPKENTMAETNYDHRDTRYAYVNMKDIIKRNYKDKSLVWWKDPVIMNIISFVIMSIVFVGACWFLIAKIGSLIHEVTNLISELGPISENIARAVQGAQNINSGVIPA